MNDTGATYGGPVRRPLLTGARAPRLPGVLDLPRPLSDSLRTDRLLLRRPRPGDADACFALESDPRTAVHRPGGPLDRDQSDAELTRNLADWADDGLGYWIVEQDGQVVGRTGQRRLDAPCALLPGVAAERLLNTYYRFAPSVWGTGIAFEAARAALDALTTTGLRYPVVAITTAGNTPSQRLARRLGMTFHRQVPVPGLPDSVELRLPATD